MTTVRIAPTNDGRFMCTMYQGGRYIAREVRSAPADAFSQAQRLGAGWAGSFPILRDADVPALYAGRAITFVIENGR